MTQKIPYVMAKPEQKCQRCQRLITPQRDDRTFKPLEGYKFFCPLCGCGLGYGGNRKNEYIQGLEPQECPYCKTVVRPERDDGCFENDQGYGFICPKCGKFLGYGGRRNSRKNKDGATKKKTTSKDFRSDKYCQTKPRQQCPRCGIIVVPQLNRYDFQPGKGYMFICPICEMRFGYGGMKNKTHELIRHNVYVTFKPPQICPVCHKYVMPQIDKQSLDIKNNGGYDFYCPGCHQSLGRGGLLYLTDENGSRKKGSKFTAKELGIDYCQICGIVKDEVNELQLEVHHLHAIVDGGMDIRANILVVCHECHKMIHQVRKNRWIGEKDNSCESQPDILP